MSRIQLEAELELLKVELAAKLTLAVSTGIRTFLEDAMSQRRKSSVYGCRPPDPIPAPEKKPRIAQLTRKETLWAIAVGGSGWWTRNNKKFYKAINAGQDENFDSITLRPDGSTDDGKDIRVKFSTIISRWKHVKELP